MFFNRLLENSRLGEYILLPFSPQRLKSTGFIRFSVVDQLHKNVKKSEICVFEMHFQNEIIVSAVEFLQMLYL